MARLDNNPIEFIESRYTHPGTTRIKVGFANHMIDILTKKFDENENTRIKREDFESIDDLVALTALDIENILSHENRIKIIVISNMLDKGLYESVESIIERINFNELSKEEYKLIVLITLEKDLPEIGIELSEGFLRKHGSDLEVIEKIHEFMIENNEGRKVGKRFFGHKIEILEGDSIKGYGLLEFYNNYLDKLDGNINEITDYIIYKLLGDCSLFKKEYSKCIEYYEKYAKINSDYLIKIGDIYIKKLNDENMGQVYYDKAINMGNSAGYVKMSKFYKKKGDMKLYLYYSEMADKFGEPEGTMTLVQYYIKKIKTTGIGYKSSKEYIAAKKYFDKLSSKYNIPYEESFDIFYRDEIRGYKGSAKTGNIEIQFGYLSKLSYLLQKPSYQKVYFEKILVLTGMINEVIKDDKIEKEKIKQIANIISQNIEFIFTKFNDLGNETIDLIDTLVELLESIRKDKIELCADGIKQIMINYLTLEQLIAEEMYNKIGFEIECFSILIKCFDALGGNDERDETIEFYLKEVKSIQEIYGDQENTEYIEGDPINTKISELMQKNILIKYEDYLQLEKELQKTKLLSSTELDHTQAQELISIIINGGELILKNDVKTNIISYLAFLSENKQEKLAKEILNYFSKIENFKELNLEEKEYICNEGMFSQEPILAEKLVNNYIETTKTNSISNIYRIITLNHNSFLTNGDIDRSMLKGIESHLNKIIADSGKIRTTNKLVNITEANNLKIIKRLLGLYYILIGNPLAEKTLKQNIKEGDKISYLYLGQYYLTKDEIGKARKILEKGYENEKVLECGLELISIYKSSNEGKKLRELIDKLYILKTVEAEKEIYEFYLNNLNDELCFIRCREMFFNMISYDSKYTISEKEKVFYLEIVEEYQESVINGNIFDELRTLRILAINIGDKDYIKIFTTRFNEIYEKYSKNELNSIHMKQFGLLIENIFTSKINDEYLSKLSYSQLSQEFYNHEKRIINIIGGDNMTKINNIQ